MKKFSIMSTGLNSSVIVTGSPAGILYISPLGTHCPLASNVYTRMANRKAGILARLDMSTVALLLSVNNVRHIKVMGHCVIIYVLNCFGYYTDTPVLFWSVFAVLSVTLYCGIPLTPNVVSWARFCEAICLQNFLDDGLLASVPVTDTNCFTEN